MIRPCGDTDFDTIHAIINDGAEAYRGVIPADRWQEPYMSQDELRHEIDSGVRFWGYHDGRELLGVMGLQDVQDVTLIRHAARPHRVRRGVLRAVRDRHDHAGPGNAPTAVSAAQPFGPEFSMHSPVRCQLR